MLKQNLIPIYFKPNKAVYANANLAVDGIKIHRFEVGHSRGRWPTPQVIDGSIACRPKKAQPLLNKMRP